jgi:hypothetical protein
MVALTTTFLIVRIVEVGQSYDMAELMADGTYAVQTDGFGLTFHAIKLSGTHVVPNSDIVLGHVYGTVMGPYQSLVVVNKVGAKTGKDEEYVVNTTVSVGIVLTEIHVGICCLNSSPD